jgi:hypothetical protein
MPLTVPIFFSQFSYFLCKPLVDQIGQTFPASLDLGGWEFFFSNQKIKIGVKSSLLTYMPKSANKARWPDLLESNIQVPFIMLPAGATIDRKFL